MDLKSKLILLSIFIFFIMFTWEKLKPNRKISKKSMNISYKTNISILIFNQSILFILNITILYTIALNYSRYGLFYNLNLDQSLFYSILTIIFLDLLIYIWHYLNHKLDFLWRFHKAHHSNIALNSSSALRFHIGELILSIFYKSLIIIIFGIPLSLIIIFEIITTISAIFHHSNISFFKEKCISYIFIVPFLHFMHHSTIRKEHDSNYGVVFSIWDLIFKTRIYRKVKDLGLIEIEKEPEQTFIKFLNFGFKKKY